MSIGTIGIIGAGRVGSAIGEALIVKGLRVLFYDVVETQLQPLRDIGYDTTINWDDLKGRCEVVVICVPTESLPSGDCDLTIITKVVNDLKNFNGVIVQMSTCPPLTGRNISKLTKAEYVVIPSFYSMARMKYDAIHPIRIIIGTKDGKPNETASEIFSMFDGPVFYGTFEEIEMIKYTDNVLSSVIISYWNEIFLMCEALKDKTGIVVDSDRVARIIDSSAPHLRSIYRFHGKAYAGPCLPKDTNALNYWAINNLDYHPFITMAAIKVNELMRKKYGVNERPLIYRS